MACLQLPLQTHRQIMSINIKLSNAHFGTSETLYHSYFKLLSNNSQEKEI